jgi:hypothetical protein
MGQLRHAWAVFNTSFFEGGYSGSGGAGACADKVLGKGFEGLGYNLAARLA